DFHSRPGCRSRTARSPVRAGFLRLVCPADKPRDRAAADWPGPRSIPPAQLKRKCSREKTRDDKRSPPTSRMYSFHLIADAAIAGLTVNGWKILGWSGNLVFGARFIIQWIASERARKSIIPVGFWECSALGSILLLIYFAFYRHDSVGVLSALFPLPVYLRNLYFRYTHHHPKHPGNEPRPPD